MRAGAHPSHGDARALTIGMRTMRQRFAESMHAEIAGSVVVHEEVGNIGTAFLCFRPAR